MTFTELYEEITKKKPTKIIFFGLASTIIYTNDYVDWLCNYINKLIKKKIYWKKN